MGKKGRKQLPFDHPTVQRMSSNMVLAERSLFATGRVMTQFVLTAPARILVWQRLGKTSAAKRLIINCSIFFAAPRTCTR